jgi:hypothetical protein
MTNSAHWLPLRGMLRTPKGMLRVLPWLALTLLLARFGPGHSVDAAALNLAALPIPLLALAANAWLFSGAGFRETVRGLTRLGAPPGRTAVAYGLTAIAVSALLATLAAILVLSLSPTLASASLRRELLAVCPIAMLAGASYGAFFLLGSTFARGNGRILFFAADVLFSGSTRLTVVVLRGHLRSLLGSAPVATLSPLQSSLGMVAILLLALLLALYRVGGISWKRRR